MASSKGEICLKKKKPTPSTNIPLLSYRKSEQKASNSYKYSANFKLIILRVLSEDCIQRQDSPADISTQNF